MSPAANEPEPSGDGLTHVDRTGDARMVDVGGKPVTRRRARAEGFVAMRAETRERIERGDAPKGAVLATARLAGILAAKRTAELIPLCHPLPLDAIRVEFRWCEGGAPGEAALRIEGEATVTARTGAEMEALTAVSVAALTVYDMAKAIDRGMRIEGVRLLEKTGGTSGDVRAE